MSELTSFRVDKYEVYDKDEADARIAELEAEVRLATGDAEMQFRKRLQAEVALENMTQQRNAAIVKPARARIAELEAERDALRDVYRGLVGKDWNWDLRPRGDDH